MSDVIDAYNSIREDGGPIVITHTNDSIIDPIEETVTNGTNISVSTYAVRTSFKEEVVDGTMIKSGDCKFIVPAYGLDSLSIKNDYKKCSLVFAGETWNILDVKPISPSGVDIIYYLHSRK